MFGPAHYVPILHTKGGELDALAQLPGETLNHITPLMVVMANSDPGKVKRRLDRLQGTMSPNQPDIFEGLDHCRSRRFFLDFGEWHRAHPGDLDELEGFAVASVERGLRAVPVVCPLASPDFTAMIRPMLNSGEGACIRVTGRDLDEAEEDEIGRRINGLLQRLALPPEQLDLVLDFGQLAPQGFGAFKMARVVIDEFPHIHRYRSFTFASGAYPDGHGGVEGGGMATFDRRDLSLWRRICANSYVKRVPSFGDYGPLFPVPFIPGEVPPPIAPKTRYCTDSDWWFEKAYSTKNPEHAAFDQYFELAEHLVGSRVFMGAEHCSGCHAWALAAKRIGTSGSHLTWIRAAVVHHLTLTANQIAAPLSDQLPSR